MNMLRHVLGVLGMTSTVVRHDEYAAGASTVTTWSSWAPDRATPGRPTTPRPRCFRRAVDRLLDPEQPFLAVCLGHQALCYRLGIPLAFKDIVFQGTQSPVDRRPHRAGRVLQHLRRPGQRRRPAAGGRRRRGRPLTGDVHSAWPALPRHPVPRRVDPHRARLRPDPRSRPGPAGHPLAPVWSIFANAGDASVLVRNRSDLTGALGAPRGWGRHGLRGPQETVAASHPAAGCLLRRLPRHGPASGDGAPGTLVAARVAELGRNRVPARGCGAHFRRSRPTSCWS